MKVYSKYIGFVYFKYVFILFIALECFYVGIDILTNLKNLPASANSTLIYVALTATVAVSYTLPLSLIFALIITKFNMIRSNELISFYALGVSKNSLIKTPFLIALAITFVYIYLNSTPFAYALKMQKNIENFSQIGTMGSDMLLKYEGKYIYFKSLNSGANAANGVVLLDVNNSFLSSRAFSPSGVYKDGFWEFSELNSTKAPEILEISGSGLEHKFYPKINMLKGFEPNTITNVYDASNTYTIKEALDLINTFKDQGVNVGSIKANLYNMVFFPLFAPLMVLILYYYMPVIGRFFNLALMSFVFFIVTLCIWGMLFVLVRFSINSVIAPELGIILPIFLIFSFGLYLIFKHR